MFFTNYLSRVCYVLWKFTILTLLPFNFSLLHHLSHSKKDVQTNLSNLKVLVENSCALEFKVLLRCYPFRSKHSTEQPHMIKLPSQQRNELIYSPFESCPGPVIMSGSELLDIHPYGRARVLATISHKTTP